MSLLSVFQRFRVQCLLAHLQTGNSLRYFHTKKYTEVMKVKWIRPSKVLSYMPSKAGDLKSYDPPGDDVYREYYDKCELLQKNTNENVKKIFLMMNQSSHVKYNIYKNNLINKVKAHKLDKSSTEVKIAKLTAHIRLLQHYIETKKRRLTFGRKLHELVHRRKRLLKIFRKYDYKKFEWLLDQLDLKFIPDPTIAERVTRKKSLKLLIELRRQKLKEQKLASLKQELDEKKLPFLEKKLNMLKIIKEREANLKLEPTVTESDIQNVISQMERVKLEVEENKKCGYLRKVHPYTLQVYNPNKLKANSSED